MEERYEPLKDLGVGNFGVARLVRDKKTKELVAVKYIERGKKDDDHACKFFKWLDTSICCTHGAATTPIVIAKFKQLKHAVEVSNEELNQAHALIDATLERERVAK
ncbi:hypothetical protein SO802_017107 [Lithocarpus litseifolius]|uniref:Protein kinase domain-containing protein n=1 Tax=Lithocarpus litseifolius TaxID=425828 RepID=A0AAW2CZ21_9ROSI